MTTKLNISKKIRSSANLSLKDSSLLVNFFFSFLKKHIYSKDIKISGFGTFVVHESPKRIGRNPKTKESYIIKSRKKIKLKVSNKIRNSLN